jgi:hypothetical protein
LPELPQWIIRSPTASMNIEAFSNEPEFLHHAKAANYLHLGMLYVKNNQADRSIDAFAKAVELDPDGTRAVLREELKKLHSLFESIRYRTAFTRLLKG